MGVVLIPELSKLSLATAIMALTPVPCYCMTSFSYGGKKVRDVGLTCRSHLSNIMPDSIFYDSMGWGITCRFFSYFFFVSVFCFFQRGITTFFLSLKEMDSVVLSIQHQWTLENLNL